MTRFIEKLSAFNFFSNGVAWSSLGVAFCVKQ